MRRHLILVTITFPHEFQLLKLQQCLHALHGQQNITWIVVEDAQSRGADTAGVLAVAEASGGIRTVHLAHGPTRLGGHAQRNVALKYIRDQRLNGVVYQME